MNVCRSVAIFVASCLLIVAGETSLYAGRLFLLIAADTSKEGGIFLSTGPDTGFMFDVFFANVPPDQLVIYGISGGTPDEPGGAATWDGPDIRYDLSDMGNKLLKAIDNCPAGPDDTIVFFYTGHGAHDSKGHFLLMPDQKTTLARQTIIKRIQQKRPRLAVVITDSCSNMVDRGILPGPAMAMAEPERVSPLFDALFFQTSGLVDVNSSSEGQVASGPIGGGLLVLALAYVGNKPNFRRSSGRAIDVAPSDAKAVIPAMPYDSIIAEQFAWNEHGIEEGFNPELPSYGFLWMNAERRLTWSDLSKSATKKVDELFRALHPNGIDVGKPGQPQRTQTPQFYSLPQMAVPRPTQRLSLSRGDVILSVNGQRIRGRSDCIQAVDNSPQTMTFTVRDSRDGTVWQMQTQLRSSSPKFGVDVEDYSGSGAYVTRVYSGTPSTNNLVLGKLSGGTDGDVGDDADWSDAIYRPEPGDRIVEINGTRIDDTGDFQRAVKGSPDWMTFRVIENGTGRSFTLRTRLDPPDASTRLGIGAVDTQLPGVQVQYVREGHPGARCQLAQ